MEPWKTLTLGFAVGVGDGRAGVAEVAALDALLVAVGDAARVLLARVTARRVVAHVAPDGWRGDEKKSGHVHITSSLRWMGVQPIFDQRKGVCVDLVLTRGQQTYTATKKDKRQT